MSINKRVDEPDRSISVADFEKGQALIWGRIRGVGKVSESQFNGIVIELAKTFPEIESFSEYKKTQFMLYLLEEILAYKNPEYVPTRVHSDFRKEGHKKATKREIAYQEREEAFIQKERQAVAIAEYALSQEGLDEIKALEKELESLGKYMTHEEFLEEYENDILADDIWNDNYEIGKKRLPILQKLSKLHGLDLHDAEFPADTIL